MHTQIANVVSWLVTSLWVKLTVTVFLAHLDLAKQKIQFTYFRANCVSKRTLVEQHSNWGNEQMDIGNVSTRYYGRKILMNLKMIILLGCIFFMNMDSLPLQTSMTTILSRLWKCAAHPFWRKKEHNYIHGYNTLFPIGLNKINPFGLPRLSVWTLIVYTCMFILLEVLIRIFFLFS